MALFSKARTGVKQKEGRGATFKEVPLCLLLVLILLFMENDRTSDKSTSRLPALTLSL